MQNIIDKHTELLNELNTQIEEMQYEIEQHKGLAREKTSSLKKNLLKLTPDERQAKIDAVDYHHKTIESHKQKIKIYKKMHKSILKSLEG